MGFVLTRVILCLGLLGGPPICGNPHIHTDRCVDICVYIYTHMSTHTHQRMIWICSRDHVEKAPMTHWKHRGMMPHFFRSAEYA